jgi:hypothetical protein
VITGNSDKTITSKRKSAENDVSDDLGPSPLQRASCGWQRRIIKATSSRGARTIHGSTRCRDGKTFGERLRNERENEGGERIEGKHMPKPEARSQKPETRNTK